MVCRKSVIRPYRFEHPTPCSLASVGEVSYMLYEIDCASYLSVQPPRTAEHCWKMGSFRDHGVPHEFVHHFATSCITSTSKGVPSIVLAVYGNAVWMM